MSDYYGLHHNEEFSRTEIVSDDGIVYSHNDMFRAVKNEEQLGGVVIYGCQPDNPCQQMVDYVGEMNIEGNNATVFHSIDVEETRNYDPIRLPIGTETDGNTDFTELQYTDYDMYTEFVVLQSGLVYYRRVYNPITAMTHEEWREKNNMPPRRNIRGHMSFPWTRG